MTYIVSGGALNSTHSLTHTHTHTHTHAETDKNTRIKTTKMQPSIHPFLEARYITYLIITSNRANNESSSYYIL